MTERAKVEDHAGPEKEGRDPPVKTIKLYSKFVEATCNGRDEVCCLFYFISSFQANITCQGSKLER